jgi:hypothetical protein
MSKWIVAAAFLGAGLAAACGSSGSGVSGGKALGSLSDAEIDDLCAYVVDVQGPPRTIGCAGDLRVTVGTLTREDCADETRLIRELAGCTATVDDAESCREDLADLTDEDLCSDAVPTSCVAVFACAKL